MPLLSSSKKANRQNIKNASRNRNFREKMKAIWKDFTQLITKGQADKAADMLSDIYTSVDTAAKKNIIRKGKAANMKSRATKLLKNSNATIPAKKKKTPSKTNTLTKKAPVKKSSTKKK